MRDSKLVVSGPTSGDGELAMSRSSCFASSCSRALPHTSQPNTDTFRFMILRFHTIPSSFIHVSLSQLFLPSQHTRVRTFAAANTLKTIKALATAYRSRVNNIICGVERQVHYVQSSYI